MSSPTPWWLRFEWSWLLCGLCQKLVWRQRHSESEREPGPGAASIFPQVFPQGQGLRTADIGRQSCVTRCHSSSWMQLCLQPETSTGHFFPWTNSTFSFCFHQMGWQQVWNSLAELLCQTFFHYFGVCVCVCVFLVVASSMMPFLHYFSHPCRRPKRSTVCIPLLIITVNSLHTNKFHSESAFVSPICSQVRKS